MTASARVARRREPWFIQPRAWVTRDELLRRRAPRPPVAIPMASSPERPDAARRSCDRPRRAPSPPTRCRTSRRGWRCRRSTRSRRSAPVAPASGAARRRSPMRSARHRSERGSPRSARRGRGAGSGTRRAPPRCPAAIVRGSPSPRSRAVSGRSRRAAASGTADASANSSRASVISARWCTVALSTSTLTIPQLGLARSSPAPRKSSGPDRFRSANHSEPTDHPKTTRDSAMSVASLIPLAPRRSARR